MPTIAGRSRSRDPWSLHVAAQPALIEGPPPRGYNRDGLILRPRSIHSPAHATAVLAAAEKDPRVLPRWIQRPGGIRDASADRPLDPETAERWAWVSRKHWVHTVVSLAFHVHRDVMARHRICPDTLRRWAEAKSLFAKGDPSRVVVRPKTLAGLMCCSVETVKRYNRAAREAGLEHVIERGRMLTLVERKQAQRAGSTQRGLATVVALCTPARVVDMALAAVHAAVGRNTPSGGEVTSLGKSCLAAFSTASATANGQRTSLRSAGHPPEWRLRHHGDPPDLPKRPQQPQNGSPGPEQAAPLPPGAPTAAKPAQRRPRKRRNDPGLGLAIDLIALIPWLRNCQRGRIAPQLNRYARAEVPIPWTAARIMRAMDAVNHRLNYNAPTTARKPWALLAWYLAQIDPIADHPTAGRLVGRPLE